MARVVAFIPDLLFGSNVVGALSAAGHDVRLVPELSEGTDLARADVLVVDLTADAAARLATIPAERPPTLGFYAHVEQDVRALAEEAGLDLVVPRSRMAREGAGLVDRLAGA
jgi:nucleoside-diphosphate-sugar epimerase